jgi:hypothetical protein
MNKRFLISWLVITILTMAFGFIVHGTILAKDYEALVPSVFRSPEDAEKLFHFMILANILSSFAFTWIYRKGVEAGKPAVGQGIRFGLAVAVLVTIPTFLIYYVVQPIPGMLAVKQILFEIPTIIIMGVVVALLNPPGK